MSAIKMIKAARAALVRQLHQEGFSQREIAAGLGMSCYTVCKDCQREPSPAGEQPQPSPMVHGPEVASREVAGEVNAGPSLAADAPEWVI